MLETVIAVFLLISLILYALMGGADFGGGMWDLLATGRNARKQRAAISEAIGPIWEANHVWLILVVVLLFTCFPSAFSAMMIALHIPLTAMLLGIVLRGTTFTFRKYDSQKDGVQYRWSTIFGISSFFTPFLQGLTLGALATGQIEVVNGKVTSGFFAGWLNPFSISCGLFALTLFAFLAAVYLTVDTQNDTELREDFRMRAISAEFILIPIGLVVFASSKPYAPLMHQELTQWWAPILLTWTFLSAIVCLFCLWKRKFRFARVAAILLVTLILCGWAISQFPYLIAPSVTIYNSAAPIITLRLVLLALGLGSVILLPSLAYLFYIFKGKSQKSPFQTGEAHPS
jgi:cytochrome bd ubiquinol oxidase subunit II